MKERYTERSKNMIYKKMIVFLYCCVLGGCGYYSFSGSLAPHLNTVAVPLLDNKTVEFGLAEELTDILIEEFTRDNSLKIADKSTADILVEGSILRIDDRAGAFTADEEVQDIKIYISVSVKVHDQVKRTLLWEERITKWGDYDPDGGPDGREEAIFLALEKVSEEILNKTVSGW